CVRADLREAAEGDLVRTFPRDAVSDGARIQHGSTAATRLVAEDAAQHRRSRTAAVSGPRSVAHREAVHGTLDGAAYGARRGVAAVQHLRSGPDRTTAAVTRVDPRRDPRIAASRQTGARPTRGDESARGVAGRSASARPRQTLDRREPATDQ